MFRAGPAVGRWGRGGRPGRPPASGADVRGFRRPGGTKPCPEGDGEMSLGLRQQTPGSLGALSCFFVNLFHFQRSYHTVLCWFQASLCCFSNEHTHSTTNTSAPVTRGRRLPCLRHALACWPRSFRDASRRRVSSPLGISGRVSWKILLRTPRAVTVPHEADRHAGIK